MVTRRELLVLCSACPALPAATLDERRGLTLECELSRPPAIPPPLEPSAPARAVIAFEGPGAAARCVLSVAVRLEGEECLLPVAAWTGSRHLYWRLREHHRLPAFRGAVRSEEGRWSVEIGGREAFFAATGPAALGPAGERPDRPWLAYRHALAANWREGPLGSGPVRLLRLESGVPRQRIPVAGESIATGGDLDGWLSRLGASPAVAAWATGPGGARAARFVREADRASFEPFALRNYPGEIPGLPASARVAGPEALAAYRRREQVRMAGLLVVAIDSVASPQAVDRLLPPPCAPSDRPAVRVMAIRGLDSPTLDEAWLFAECAVMGRRAWYAISHVRASLAGSEFGREVLGYPTRAGAVQASVGGNMFGLAVERGGRRAYGGRGSYGGFSTGTSLGEMTVASLRLAQADEGAPRRGEIVLQSWRYQGLRRPVMRAGLEASFPAGDRSGGPDDWSGMGPIHPYAAMVLDGATMQRHPGRVVADFTDPGAYYRDRCDGALPWEPHPAAPRRKASD